MDEVTFEEFERAVRADGRLGPLVAAVGEDAAAVLKEEEPRRFYVPGAETVVITLAGYALYRYIKLVFDHQQDFDRVKILALQAQVTRPLVDEDEIPAKDAAALVEALGKHLERSSDSELQAIVEAGVKVLGKKE